MNPTLSKLHDVSLVWFCRPLVILKKSTSLLLSNNVFGIFPILVQKCDNEQTSCSTFPTLISTAPVFGSLENLEGRCWGVF